MLRACLKSIQTDFQEFVPEASFRFAIHWKSERSQFKQALSLEMDRECFTPRLL